MKRVLIGVGVCSLMLMAYAVGKDEKPGYGIMVWPNTCITEVQVGQHTRIEAPMVDGKPDMTRALLLGVHATYTPACGHIEIRK
jgi:hypothetical protein